MPFQGRNGKAIGDQKMIGKERFRKLFGSRPVIRTMYDSAGRESIHGYPLSSRGEDRNIQLDGDGKGFRLPFFRPYNGCHGYHYRLKEENA